MNRINLCSLFIIVAVTTASPILNSTFDSDSSCNINHYNEVASVTANCTNIRVGSFEVPAGQTLKLALQSGANLTFNGQISFNFRLWNGPLMWITGNNVTVQGSTNHLINARGQFWWDGKGDHSLRRKPHLMLIQATGGSLFKNIKVKNCPHNCIGISDSHDLTLQYWDIDCKDGDTKGGANTDGFVIAKSSEVTIRDSSVYNQDDCISVIQGQDLLFDNMQCTGGHGLSIEVGNYDTGALNTVHNVTFQNSAVKNSRNGIHVKTVYGSQEGQISAVTYKNINLSDISHYGINVQQDFTNNGDSHLPKSNIKIKQLTMQDITGTLNGSSSQQVYILCGAGNCNNWSWNGVNIKGASKINSCNFAPEGYTC